MCRLHRMPAEPWVSNPNFCLRWKCCAPMASFVGLLRPNQTCRQAACWPEVPTDRTLFSITHELVCFDRLVTSQAVAAPVAWVPWGDPADSRHIRADECPCAVWCRRLRAWPCRPRPYGVQARTGLGHAPNLGRITRMASCLGLSNFRQGLSVF